jgi:hypothetical protein
MDTTWRLMTRSRVLSIACSALWRRCVGVNASKALGGEPS